MGEINFDSKHLGQLGAFASLRHTSGVRRTSAGSVQVLTHSSA